MGQPYKSSRATPEMDRGRLWTCRCGANNMGTSWCAVCRLPAPVYQPMPAPGRPMVVRQQNRRMLRKVLRRERKQQRRQEKWMYSNNARIGAPVVVGMPQPLPIPSTVFPPHSPPSYEQGEFDADAPGYEITPGFDMAPAPTTQPVQYAAPYPVGLPPAASPVLGAVAAPHAPLAVAAPPAVPQPVVEGEAEGEKEAVVGVAVEQEEKVEGKVEEEEEEEERSSAEALKEALARGEAMAGEKGGHYVLKEVQGCFHVTVPQLALADAVKAAWEGETVNVTVTVGERAVQSKSARVVRGVVRFEEEEFEFPDISSSSDVKMEVQSEANTLGTLQRRVRAMVQWAAFVKRRSRTVQFFLFAEDGKTPTGTAEISVVLATAKRPKEQGGLLPRLLFEKNSSAFGDLSNVVHSSEEAVSSFKFERDTKDCLWSGWAEKRGGFLNLGFKPRFFRLNGRKKALYYFATDTDTFNTLKGAIALWKMPVRLDGVDGFTMPHSHRDYADRNRIVLVDSKTTATAKRTFVLRTKTRAEALALYRVMQSVS